MTDAETGKKREAFVHGEGMEQTREYQKMATIQVLMDALTKVWPTETWDTTDFSEAVREVIGKSKIDDLSKLQKLADKLKASTEAANTPEEERTPEQQDALNAEMRAADEDGDGEVKKAEALKRMYDLFAEVGLEDQAEWFRARRQARSQQ